MKDNKLIKALLCINLVIGIITLGATGYLIANDEKMPLGGMVGQAPSSIQGMPDDNSRNFGDSGSDTTKDSGNS